MKEFDDAVFVPISNGMGYGSLIESVKEHTDKEKKYFLNVSSLIGLETLVYLWNFKRDNICLYIDNYIKDYFWDFSELKRGGIMPENMYTGTHKHTNKKWRDNYDKIFKQKKDSCCGECKKESKEKK